MKTLKIRHFNHLFVVHDYFMTWQSIITENEYGRTPFYTVWLYLTSLIRQHTCIIIKLYKNVHEPLFVTILRIHTCKIDNFRVQNRQIPIEISIKIIIEAENYTQAHWHKHNQSSDLVMLDFNTVISLFVFCTYRIIWKYSWFV